MRAWIVNMVAMTVLAVLFVAYQFGGLTASNAFFCGALAIVSYTGWRLAEYEGHSLDQAVRAILARPEARQGLASYVSYMFVLAVGSVMVFQALLA